MRELIDAPGVHDMSGDFARKSMKLARILRVRIQRGDFFDGHVLSRLGVSRRRRRGPSCWTRSVLPVRTARC